MAYLLIKFVLMKGCYPIILIYIYIDIPNDDNVTMYCYMYFTTLLHVIYYVFLLHVFLNVCYPTEQVSQSFAHVDRHWPNHRQQLLGMHVLSRSGYFNFSHTLEIHWANLHCTHAQYAFILNTVLLLYYYSMLYYIKMAWI